MLTPPETFNKTCQIQINLRCTSFCSPTWESCTSVTFPSGRDSASEGATPFTLVLILASSVISVGPNKMKRTL